MSALPKLTTPPKPHVRAKSPLERLREYRTPISAPPLRRWRNRHEVQLHQMAHDAVSKNPENALLIWHGNPQAGEYFGVDVVDQKTKTCIELRIPETIPASWGI